MVVVWSCPTQTACQVIARRMGVEGSAFRIDQSCQRIVFVIYRRKLEVDIARRQHIDARGGPYGHVRNFVQAPEARNDLVRILKDWSACGVVLLDSVRNTAAALRCSVILSGHCSCSEVSSRCSIRQIRTTTWQRG